MTTKFTNAGSASAAFAARNNWLSSLNCQFDFYQKSDKRRREDPEFDWVWLERYPKGLGSLVKHMLSRVARSLRLRAPSGVSQEWVNMNAPLLWETRMLLEDELSKLLFDSMLTLRCSSYSQYYFPRLDFEDFVTIVNETPFMSNDLPLDYAGLPLRVFNLELHQQHQALPLTIISTKVQINLLNSYRQYFVQRGQVDLTPAKGDVVLDCGACIGEVSTLIAGLVGIQGEVHLFDPVPLHVRYCQLQASLNPEISHVLHINTLAVGEVTQEVVGMRNDTNSISPGGLSINSYSMTTLDDYVSNKKLSRVNVIKMDIEGAEMAALQGATQLISEFKPRLAISAYHKPEDLWEIPHKLKSQNGNYRLYFGHHSPIFWESVFYAA